MGLDLIRWKANERVGLPDIDALSDLVLEEQIRDNRDRVLPEAINPQVIGGFSLTNYTLGVSSAATLNYGRALLKLQKDGVLSHGFLLGLQFPTSYLLDFSTAGDHTYNVYVRAVYADSDHENRVFWNAGASSEFVDYTSTRRTVTWEVTYQSSSAASPGSEWMHVWDITVVGNVITAVTDKRRFYYEGRPEASYPHEWGGGVNDRNSDRAAYGVTDRWTWDQALRRQLADIIGDPAGAHGWWSLPAIELLSLNLEHYSEADDATHKGKHKTVTFGDPAGPNFWQWGSVDAQSFSILGQNQVDGAFIAWNFDDVAGDSYVNIGPRGALAAMTDGDTHRQNIGDIAGVLDFEEVSARTSNVLRTKIWKGGGIEYMRLEMGLGATDQGLKLNQPGYNYFVKTTTIDIIIPFDVSIQAATPEWLKTGPSDGNTGDSAAENGLVHLVTNGAQAGKVIPLSFRDFPDGATLESIDVLWRQTAKGGGGAEMRLYAGRHQWGGTDPANTHDAGQDATAGFLHGVAALNSIQNYIEYNPSVHTAETRRFKPDQNNTGWDRKQHWLEIGIISPASAQSCTVFGIKTRWTYTHANPWPVI